MQVSGFRSTVYQTDPKKFYFVGLICSGPDLYTGVSCMHEMGTWVQYANASGHFSKESTPIPRISS